MAFKKYSTNPDDWFRICDECKVKYPCKTYNSFAGFQKKIELGEPIRCNSCAQTGKEMIDEFKEKCRNRIFTEEQRKANGDRNRARYANMTPEEKEEVSRIQQRANQKRWEGKEEEKKLYFKNFNELARNISPEKREAKNKKISEANKKPDSLRNNPETWRLPCSGCDSEIPFEKYHRFQNAKSGIKKGHDLFCSECKEKNKLVKRNPLLDVEWKIECHDEECKMIIEYENYPAFKRALERIEAGAPKYCDHCRETKHPKKDGAKKKYSNNPDDWFIKCRFDDCEKVLTYNSYGSYAHNCKRILKGDPPMCYSCAAKNWERTDEYREKLKGRTHTEESKKLMRARFENMTELEFSAYCQKQSEYSIAAWQNLTPEKRAIRLERLRKNNDVSPEEKERRRKILSEKAYERIKKYGSRLGFQPAYNVDTIDYIESELNKRFSTTFMHGSNGGEFKLFDENLKIHYFADAYCPKLNIWIEFDERHKFKQNQLIQEHIDRHQQIKNILNCEIFRFRVFKNKQSIVISEFTI